MSFADAAILDAVGRKVRVDLVLKPVTASSPSRLISRFLGFLGDDRLAIEEPRTEKKEKVFLPSGWLLGMSFEADNMWLQTRTTVLDHCLFLVQPARRADALVVQKPWPS